MNVVLVTNIPNPYRVPLFEELNQQLNREDIDFKVLFGDKTYARRKFKLDKNFDFKHDYLRSLKWSILGNSEKTMFLYNGLLRFLLKEKPDKIIVGGFSLATVKIFIYCLLLRKKWIIWSGSIDENGAKSTVRSAFRQFLVKRANSFIAYGTKAKEYLVSLGATNDKVHIAINTVDVKAFQRSKDSSLDLESPKELITVGYLSKRKNIDTIIKALKKLSESRRDFVLRILGDGDERSNLEHLINDLGLEDFVRIEGFIQKEDLPKFYHQSYAMLFPTNHDIWGLVLNEAMAASLPCLSTLNAGATFDLITDKENGLVVDFNDEKSLLTNLNYCLDNPDKMKEIGDSAAKTISQKAKLQNSAVGFLNAIKQIS